MVLLSTWTTVWPGNTMHSLVKWRAGASTASTDHRAWSTFLITASCRTHAGSLDACDFTEHLRHHLPPEVDLQTLRDRAIFGEDGIASVISSIGVIWLALGEYTRAKSFLDESCALTKKLFGDVHARTFQAKVELCVLLTIHGDSLGLDGKVLSQQRSTVSEYIMNYYSPGAQEGSIARLHAKTTAPSNVGVCTPIVRERFRQRQQSVMNDISQRHDLKQPSDTVDNSEAESLARFSEDQELEVGVDPLQNALKAGVEELGTQHEVVIQLKSNLAHLFGLLGRWSEEKQLVQDVLTYEQGTLGKGHPSTPKTLERLAHVHRSMLELGRSRLLMKHCVDRSDRTLGKDDPHAAKRATWLSVWLDTDTGDWKSDLDVDEGSPQDQRSNEEQLTDFMSRVQSVVSNKVDGLVCE